MSDSMRKLTDFIRNEQGATSAEYAILASLIAAVIVGAVFILGQKTVGLFNTVPGDW